MAVSCYENAYLLALLEEQFVQSGGPRDWLAGGLEKADCKVRRLADLNEVLAFRPWTLGLCHIESLLSSEVEEHNESSLPSSWSIPELLHAGAILAHFHSLCGLLFAQGVKGAEILLPEIPLNWDAQSKKTAEVTDYCLQKNSLSSQSETATT